MTTFQVWLRAVGGSTKIQVDGKLNVAWLRDRLRERGLICTDPLSIQGTNRYIFRIDDTPEMDRAAVQEFVEHLPEVELMHAPA